MSELREEMMPPKKSKAARKDTGDHDAHVEPPPPVRQSEPIEPMPAYISDDGEEDRPNEQNGEVKWEFEGRIIEGKRKRQIPASEQKLHSWVEEHFYEKEESRIKIEDVYNNYLDAMAASEGALDSDDVMKYIKSQFPKGVGVKETSPYHGVIKERKSIKKNPKVQGETLKIKFRDILEKILKETLGNPKNGIRFNNIKQHVMAEYPALRVDLRPSLLQNALQMGVRYGYIDCVKGIGKCGFYRIPSPDDDKQEQKEKSKKKPQKEGTEEVKDEKEDGVKEEDEVKKEGEEGDSEDKKEKPKSKPKKKKSNKKKAQKTYRSHKVHSEPERIDDTFELAMTFMSEPKQASVTKIRKYIERYYDVNNLETRLRKMMQTGLENGWWEQISGTGISGTFRLNVDEFDPEKDDDLVGMIINAMMACNEPKQCSANLIKKYVIEYHPELKVADKPHLFKKALQRATKNNLLIQLSGIGCSGSFQLAQQFMPNPTILAGKDTDSDYGDVSSDEESGAEGYDPADLALYQDAYKPRPTKRHGFRNAAIAEFYDASGLQAIPREPAPKKRPAAKPAKKIPAKSSAKSSAKSAKKPQKKGQRGSGRVQAKPKYADSSSDESSEEEESSDEEAPPPKKTTSRRTPAKKPVVKGRVKKEESLSEAEEESEDEEPPPPKKSRGKPTPKKSPAKGRGKKQELLEDEDESSDEEAPPPTKSRGRTPPAKKQGRGKPPASSSDEDSATEDEAPPPKRARGPPTPRTEPQPKASPTKKSKGRKGRK